MKNVFLAVIAALVLSSCNNDTDKLVTIKTEMGEMTVLLYDETPTHKANFIGLAESGKYDGTFFHRVMEDFMIQGGDLYRTTDESESEGDRLSAEIVPQFVHTKGALSAARQPDSVNPELKSSSCQFYIVDGQSWDNLTTDVTTLHTRLNQLLEDSLNNPELFAEFDVFRKARDRDGFNKWAVSKREFLENKFEIDLSQTGRTSDNEAYEKAGGGSPFLDGQYTIFGRVVEGLDVIDKIAAVETFAVSQFVKDIPVDTLYVTMEVKTMSKSEITEKYGYEYPEVEQ